MADSIWNVLSERLDVGSMKPKLASDVEVAHFTTRWGTRYTMVRSPRGPVYYRLPEAGGLLLSFFDGTRTVREIIVESLRTSASFDPAIVTDLVKLLHESGYLEQPWIDTYAAVRSRTMHTHRRALAAAWTFFRKQTIVFPRADRAADLVYRAGGRLLFTKPAQVVLVGLLVGGVWTFVLNTRSDRLEIGGESLAVGFGLLLALDLAASIIHEVGHALAIRHANRLILSAGFQLYLGHPAFFIDSADILMTPPRARIRNAWYGPYLSFVIAGIASIVVWAWPSLALADVIFSLSALTYLTVVLNLIPFLELDGYWILTDLLEVPDLRPRSFAFLARELPAKIRSRTGLTRFEWGLTAFGVVGVVFTALALVTSWYFWGPIFSGFVREMWRAGWPTRIALLVLAIIVLGPLVHGFRQATASLGRRVRSAAQQVKFLTETHWRREAADLITRLPLLAEIPLEDLNDLAGRVSHRRFHTGQAIVRRGDAADSFYVIRRGRAVVVDELPDGAERVVRALGRGEAFGELALIESTPRIATVRADTPTEVFAVDKGSFDRLIAPALAKPDRWPTFSTTAEVWSLAPFRHLDADRVAAIAKEGRWVNVPAGEAVVRRGEPGDAFYVVASGQFRVETEDHTTVLKAGDFFGELALLLNVPRQATVAAVTPGRLFRLDRPAFDRLIAETFRRPSLRGTYTPRYLTEVH